MIAFGLHGRVRHGGEGLHHEGPPRIRANVLETDSSDPEQAVMELDTRTGRHLVTYHDAAGTPSLPIRTSKILHLASASDSQERMQQENPGAAQPRVAAYIDDVFVVCTTATAERAIEHLKSVLTEA